MDNLILIGMPSSGKSTAGKLAAERLNFRFIDGDTLLIEKTGKSLSAIIEERGTEGFLALEEELLCAIDGNRLVIAPGGSVVYEANAMAHLEALGTVVYLKVGLEEVKKRIPSFTARGVVMQGNLSSLDELYTERTPLYEQYADITLDCTGKTPAETAEEIIALVTE